MDDEYQEHDESFAEDATLAESGRKCTIFVVDVSEAMLKKRSDGKTYLNEAFRRLASHLNYLALNSSLREFVSVIFLNAPPDNAQNGIYVMYKMDNVTVELNDTIYHLSIADDLAKEFSDLYGSGSSQSDISELIFSCRRCFSDIGNVAQKRVIFYSYNYDPYDDPFTKAKHLELVAKRMAKVETDIHFAANLIDFPLGEKPDDFWDTIDPGYKYRKHPIEPTTEFIEASLRSAAVVPFQLGGSVEMAVSCYYICHERHKPSSAWLDAETNEVVERKGFLADEGPAEDEEFVSISAQISQNPRPIEDGEQPELSELEWKTAIGTTEIYLNRQERDLLGRIESPNIRLLGFKPISELKDSWRMGESVYLYPLDKVVTGSQNLYRSLYESCLKKQVFALARCTFRSNTTAKLYALLPQKASPREGEEFKPVDLHRYEGFHAVKLPLKQNKRDLNCEFEKETRQLIDPMTKPSSVISSLVDNLTEDYTPELFFNPQVQSYNRLIESLAMKYSFDKCQKLAKEVDQHKAWFDVKDKDFVEKELARISTVLAKDPEDEKLARKRKQGTKYDGSSKKAKE
ncbi:unnamed protein product [Bursaphelenchus xylophilus]|uniref:(pine wood nematode) hypothetical protein n=1 Tax=Bursaphelenchus xylophilus TaxID=6326 RepID=A0A1I7RLB3_BURXY|nr:unnamed protein product [Bursaphelenchus xylophilus]CAG9083206.1 unnamed protein product [Bursaphelenchus xylophilus]